MIHLPNVLQRCFHQALAVQESLEYDMELLCLTGVEDKLQTDVKPTLELLRNAAIKVNFTSFLFQISVSELYNLQDSKAGTQYKRRSPFIKGMTT